MILELAIWNRFCDYNDLKKISCLSHYHKDLVERFISTFYDKAIYQMMKNIPIKQQYIGYCTDEKDPCFYTDELINSYGVNLQNRMHIDLYNISLMTRFDKGAKTIHLHKEDTDLFEIDENFILRTLPSPTTGYLFNSNFIINRITTNKFKKFESVNKDIDLSRFSYVYAIVSEIILS